MGSGLEGQGPGLTKPSPQGLGQGPFREGGPRARLNSTRSVRAGLHQTFPIRRDPALADQATLSRAHGPLRSWLREPGPHGPGFIDPGR